MSTKQIACKLCSATFVCNNGMWSTTCDCARRAMSDDGTRYLALEKDGDGEMVLFLSNVDGQEVPLGDLNRKTFRVDIVSGGPMVLVPVPAGFNGSVFHASAEICRGCGKPLVIDNAWMEDGCPCNTAAGVNNGNAYRWHLLQQLQQRQSRELERSTWRPITTAPKNGTWVLIGWLGAPRMYVSRWLTNGEVWVHPSTSAPLKTPTHWMPLPANPVAV